MLGKANWSNPIRANDQQGDDDMDKGDPVGEVGPIMENGRKKVHALIRAALLYQTSSPSSTLLCIEAKAFPQRSLLAVVFKHLLPLIMEVSL